MNTQDNTTQDKMTTIGEGSDQLLMDEDAIQKLQDGLRAW